MDAFTSLCKNMFWCIHLDCDKVKAGVTMNMKRYYLTSHFQEFAKTVGWELLLITEAALIQ